MAANKATTIKEAIKRWEEHHPGENISEAEEVGFQFQWPPIEKMDNSLSVLAKCRYFIYKTPRNLHCFSDSRKEYY